LFEITDEKFDELFEKRTKTDKIVFENEPKNSKINVGHSGGGSNCWVVHGSMTESGKPLLSCDPHLGKLIHSTWYPLRMSWIDPTTKERTFVSGASIVGSPAYTYGRTPYLAFGVTALNPDVIDLYTETIENG
jgi:acyl-homoserine lactone acylase PvdQ